MNRTAIIGVVLILLGVAALAYQGFTYTSRETVVDIGPVHATADHQKTVPIPPCSAWRPWPAASRCWSPACASPPSSGPITSSTVQSLGLVRLLPHAGSGSSVCAVRNSAASRRPVQVPD